MRVNDSLRGDYALLEMRSYKLVFSVLVVIKKKKFRRRKKVAPTPIITPTKLSPSTAHGPHHWSQPPAHSQLYPGSGPLSLDGTATCHLPSLLGLWGPFPPAPSLPAPPLGHCLNNHQQWLSLPHLVFTLCPWVTSASLDQIFSHVLANLVPSCVIKWA